jgi:hypothetical protein
MYISSTQRQLCGWSPETENLKGRWPNCRLHCHGLEEAYRLPNIALHAVTNWDQSCRNPTQ